MAEDGDDPVGGSLTPADTLDERVLARSEDLMRYVEVVAALVLVVLFAIGVFDLGLQIVQRALSGDITDPLVVVGFIDTALLLFIIVEVYQTVVAYTQESETRRIVRLVIYTGVIAMVRKAIIFRTGEYASERSALFAAAAYTLIILGLAALLVVERRTREAATDAI
ncbi:phosphate-starvation-inducible PsiE family protein [Halomicroarcula sp. S1AR25-4]|uniref:phosphate-starvation-inducible PsiE family protein n=1 Tax=Haloarcula sp. S1AR25-4 TaxID=2950538 RepID=UPI002874A0D3|nr:phosphate-starvation-inducible PsiE family protein [Halomicroarcula sp. S1AR25-4]MDS0278996.1 phosphate-starvation-inducible PsiE family protein [Halomicroarcula sp. S1AR25-4]